MLLFSYDVRCRELHKIGQMVYVNTIFSCHPATIDIAFLSLYEKCCFLFVRVRGRTFFRYL